MSLIFAFIFSCLAGASEFTYEDLTQMIQVLGLQSVEEVLPKLPVEMRSNYTLMHTSRSLQSASADYPRAILFGKNAKLTCSFNGEPSQTAYDTLECFQFRDAEKKFDFRQIQFPTKTNGLSTVRFSLSNKSADGTISCTSCHKADPRPNWDNYNSWPGAYGSNEDKIGSEQSNYRKFVNIRRAHPRYKWLIQNTSALAPFRDTEVDFYISHRPNLRFTDILGRLNALRASRLLKERLPDWKRWAFVVSALECKLTSEQKAVLQDHGVDPVADLQLAKIFGDLGLKSYEWTTQIARDLPSYPERPWEHQSGFSMFSESVAMAVIQDEAQFSSGIQSILASYTRNYYGEELEFYNVLNEIVPGPDFFGTDHEKNLAAVCPEVAKTLVISVVSGVQTR